MKSVKQFSLSFLLLTLSSIQAVAGEVICYDRFSNSTSVVVGTKGSSASCQAMVIAGTVGVCFRGDANQVVANMNGGAFQFDGIDYVQSATRFSRDAILFSTYSGSHFGWNRTHNLMFRCPEESVIAESLTKLADKLDSTTDFASSRRYYEEYGFPEWFQQQSNQSECQSSLK